MISLSNDGYLKENNPLESGMVTTEYAIGCVGAGGLASILLSILKSDWVQGLLHSIFDNLLGHLF